MDEWQDLVSFDDWATKLQELLDEAEAASAVDDNARKRDIAVRLREFRRKSPKICDELDVIAKAAISALVQSAVSESLDQLNEAASELDTYVKHLREVSREANSVAGWLSLRTPRQIVDRVDETADAIETLLETTKEFDNADDIKSGVESVGRAMKKLREALESAL